MAAAASPRAGGSSKLPQPEVVNVLDDDSDGSEDAEDSSMERSQFLKSRIAKAPGMLKQVSTYLQLMDERIQTLERQIQSLEGHEVDDTTPVQEKPHRRSKTLIPTVQRVEGLHFNSMDKTHVIDIMYDHLGNAIDVPSDTSKFTDDLLADRIPGRIRINSPVILKMLERIAAPHFTSQRPVIVRPFKVLCIHKNDIHEYLTALHDVPEYSERERDIAHIQCLMDVLYKDLAYIQELKGGVLNGVAFQDLWHLFEPGDFIFSNRSTSGLEAYQVLGTNIEASGDKNSSSFVVDCFSYDYDGEGFGTIGRRIEIPAYAGDREIPSLPVLSRKFSPHEPDILHLKMRGRNFVDVTALGRVSHMSYSGSTLDDIKVELDGEVIVDFQAAYQMLKLPLPSMGLSVNLDYHSMTSKRPYHCSSARCIMCNHIDRDDVYDLQRRNTFMSEVKPPLTRKLRKDELNDLHYTLLPYRVYGYALRTRKWCSLHVEHLKNISIYPGGFEDLVLPVGYKSIIMSMVKMHSRSSSKGGVLGRESDMSSSDGDEAVDRVRGKSSGLIILLHGVPGVGKTSTVECVAAATGKPLMYLTAADLGLTSAQMEDNLEKTFSLATKWNCVLLLAEADIFLQKRSGLEMERNAMVSTFMRSLEYFSGVLFITTDRVGTLDEGCKSMIHISLYYPPLDGQSSLKIWSMNLRRFQSQHPDWKVNQNQIMVFAKRAIKSGLGWNGRQIRNAFQAAVALAQNDAAIGNAAEDNESNSDSGGSGKKPKKSTRSARKVLTAAHFKQVAEASKSFDQYLNALYGSTYGNAARFDEVRNDTYDTKRSYQAKKKEVDSSSSSPVSSDSESSNASVRHSKKKKKKSTLDYDSDSSVGPRRRSKKKKRKSTLDSDSDSSVVSHRREKMKEKKSASKGSKVSQVTQSRSDPMSGVRTMHLPPTDIETLEDTAKLDVSSQANMQAIFDQLAKLLTSQSQLRYQLPPGALGASTDPKASPADTSEGKRE